jgi:hypothetical protein
MKHILLSIVVIILLNSCDTVKGVTMEVKNLHIPIEKIYMDIKQNNDIFNYENIELIHTMTTESFGIYPKWGKIESRPYTYISLWVYGFGATIKYIDWDEQKLSPRNENEIYLYFSALYLHGAPKEILEFTEFKMIELQNFIQTQYGLNDNDLKINILYKK